MNMMKSNYPRCKTCKFRNEKGECISGKIVDDVNWPDGSIDNELIEKTKEMLIYSYSEGGSFFVGEEFGCVHHDEK